MCTVLLASLWSSSPFYYNIILVLLYAVTRYQAFHVKMSLSTEVISKVNVYFSITLKFFYILVKCALFINPKIIIFRNWYPRQDISQYSLQYDGFYCEDSFHTGITSIQVACRCVSETPQEAYKQGRLRSICVCISDKAWVCVCVTVHFCRQLVWCIYVYM